FHAATEREYQQKIYCPVLVSNIPSGFVLAATPPLVPCQIKARGKDMIVFKLNPPKVLADMANRQVKKLTFDLSPELLRYPFNLKAVEAAFVISDITVNLDRLGQKEVRVLPDVSGIPASGYIVCDSTAAEPSLVIISGPQRLLEKIDSVYTWPVKVDGRSENQRIYCRVAPPDTLLFKADPESVWVKLCFEKTQERLYKNVPVALLNRGQGYLVSFSPGTIDLAVSGPQQVLQQAEAGQFKITLDLKGLAPGHHRLQAVIELPDKLELIAADPRDFEVDIK
ncbi:MAG: CdaR family protein, partial [Deltaproteobacteria bacterium]|nr:CdaR family protein [Deltaproteobacteria bacterium]